MTRQRYDEAYKYLFSSPRITCQLLQSFVDIPQVRDIRPEDLELVDKSFISPELKRREADLLYKVNKGGRNAYIYILMEFQSSPDKAMPVRMLNYITMFYDYLFKNGKIEKLPPVLPLLIYNGTRNWDVPFKLEELIEPWLPGRYIPRFEYYPIIEKDYSDETLFEINNLVSAIMIMENSRNEEVLQENVNRVIKCLEKEHREDIRMFNNWYYHMRWVEGAENIEIDIQKGEGAMLAEVAQKLNQKILNDGISQGLEKGMEKGLEQGKLKEKQEVLIKQLDLKFGLKEEERQRIFALDEIGKLDSALEAIVLEGRKEAILEKLR